MTGSNDLERMSRRSQRSAGSQCSKNPVENRIEFLGEVLGEKTEHQLSVLLQELVFAPIATVRDRVCQMLPAVHFDHNM